MKCSLLIGVCMLLLTGTGMARAAAESNPAECAAMKRYVGQQAAGAGAAFMRSYQPGADESALPAGLASTAFVYDNALAAIALVACGDVDEARIIGNALSLAVNGDRTFADGRVRNAYRPGPVGEGPVLLPGWWDAKGNFWAEDAAQDGTATGNVAWAALALLTLHEATREPSYLMGARRLIDWVITSTSTGQGFTGGFHGYDPKQIKLTWISTEHNVDVYAAASWLFRLTQEHKYIDAATEARQFLERAFASDHFLLGTKPDGSPADPELLALDVQLWPWMALADAPPKWRSALQFAEGHLAVDGGFDFNGDRDGVWVEGTAQASLAYRMAGNPSKAAEILQALQVDRSPSGLLNATRLARISTGLSIDPTGSGEPDFFYFKRPHLGATAWATLAAVAWNPFTGRKVD
jgi:hypothetical protein